MISIIIPLYNKEKCIEKTIKSVLSQTYQDFELIIVDDGSTDNSKRLVLSIEDKRIRYFYKQNGGVSSARNYGLKQVSSDWVVFLDADDTFFPNALENFIEATKMYPKATIVVGGFMVQEMDKSILVSNKLNGYLDNPVKAVFLRKLYARPGNTFINHDVYKKGIAFIEKCSYNEDWLFSLQLMLDNKVAAFDKVLMCYDRCSSTLSNKIVKLENDVVLYINGINAANNIYAKILIFEQYYYALSRRKNNGIKDDAQIIERLMKDKFSLIEILLYFLLFKLRNLKVKLMNLN